MIVAILSFLGIKTYENINDAAARVATLTHNLSGPEAQLKELIIQVDSDANKARALEANQSAIEERLTSIVVVNEIKNWLFPDLVHQDTTRSTLLREWMNKNGLDDESFASFLRQPAFAAARKAAIKELHIPTF
jgi:hypothetical protein